MIKKMNTQRKKDGNKGATLQDPDYMEKGLF